MPKPPTTENKPEADRNRYWHAPPMLDDFFEEMATERMTSKAAVYREALMEFVRRHNPDRAQIIAEAWKVSRGRMRTAYSHAGRRRSR